MNRRYANRGWSREAKRALWSAIGAGARTGWRLRRHEDDRGTTTGRFVKKVAKYVKRKVSSANPIKDIKRAARRKRS